VSIAGVKLLANGRGAGKGTGEFPLFAELGKSMHHHPLPSHQEESPTRAVTTLQNLPSLPKGFQRAALR